MLARKLMAALTMLAIAGCDPAFPTASGTVTLADGVEVPANAYLHVRLYEGAGTSLGAATASIAVTAVTQDSFPASYATDATIGVTDSVELSAVAWLSTSAEESLEPGPGEPYGVTAFVANGCGAACGIGKTCACGETTGVDIEIDATWP